MITVDSQKAPRPLGPYSQGLVENNFVFVSGMVGIDPVTGKMANGGIKAQTARSLESLKGVLDKGGSSLEKVLKTTVYIKESGFFKEMNEVYSEFFRDHKPTRSTVVVGFVRDDILVEIDAIASKI